MNLQHVVGDSKFGGAVGDGVQHHAVTQVILAQIFACEDGAVDEHFIIDRPIGNGVAHGRRCAQRGRGLPAWRIGYRCGHWYLPREISRWIERHGFPLQVQHLVRHLNTPLVGSGRRQKAEGDIERLGPRGHVDVKRVDIDRITLPPERLAARLDDQSGNFIDLSPRRVVTR